MTTEPDRQPDAETRAYLNRINSIQMPSLDGIPIELLRQKIKESRRAICPTAPVLPDVRDLKVGRLQLAARLYRPASGVLPLLLYFPGGGWVLGDIETHDALCATLAAHSGCAILSVDYRKAPETRFPGPVNDAVDSLNWVRQNSGALGIDPSRIALGGDSAGANIAIVAALLDRGAGAGSIAWQLLVYPIVDRPSDTGSYQLYQAGYSLTAAAMRWFFQQYLPQDELSNAPEWWLAPLRAPNLGGLPATYVLVAGCDPLHDEGVAFAAKLRAAGVKTTLVEYPDQIHGFVNTGSLFPKSAHARDQIASTMRAILHPAAAPNSHP